MSTPVTITSTDQWSGQFDCTGPCRRQRLVGAEFSKKALERHRRGGGTGARASSGGGGTLRCKQCVAAAEAEERRVARERSEARARTAAASASAGDGADAGVGVDGGGGSGAGKAQEGAAAAPVACAACRRSLPPTSYNRSQLSKPPGGARCRSCVEAAAAGEANSAKQAGQTKIDDAKRAIEDAERRGDNRAKLAAESVLSALEAEVVTGLKPVALGRGRGRGRGGGGGRWSSSSRSGRGGRGGGGGKGEGGGGGRSTTSGRGSKR